MMRKAFTLVELLVVVGIMGLLGTASVGGYRAMQRGMTDKGVMQDVSSLVSAAYQRAQVDRQPTAVLFWNETLRARTDEENEVVVGKAVAIRRSGRITRKSGSLLCDEFADLNLGNTTADEDGSSSSKDKGFFLYPIDDLNQIQSSSTLPRSLVDNKVYADDPVVLNYLSGNGTKSENMVALEQPDFDHLDDEKQGKLVIWGYKLLDQGNVNWKAGMAYGFEFQTIELPHGYIFGSAYSTSVDDPVKPAGTLVFDVGFNDGSTGSSPSGSQAGILGRDTITVYALRPNRSGELTAEQVGTSKSPTSGE